MHFSIVKREVETKKFVTIVKSFTCWGLADYDIWIKADSYCKFRNLSRYVQDKFYYKVEFDFE